MKRISYGLSAGVGVLLLSGCASVMTHSGGKQGTYSGTRANVALLKDQQTSWTIKPLAAVDLPFSAVVDTLLYPWDVMREQDPRPSGASFVPASPHQNLQHKNAALAHQRTMR